ncbi:MAG: aldo/keto reductase [Bacteroidales bacterium]|jgi:predicted aldo/keto reductase-like oxidoreductase|nr:aldo/keto reductase [Bacteroidales bacterium]
MEDKDINQRGETENDKISRRAAFKYIGAGIAGAAAIYAGIHHREKIGQLFSGNTRLSSENARMATREDKLYHHQISLLAFGCMRLPKIDRDKPDIDEVQAMDLIDYAYQHGVNYFDTAWPYHQGQSETFVGKALKRYPRKSFYLADKMPTWLIESLEQAKEIFETQLKKCQVDYFDFYHLHSLGSVETYNHVYEELGVYNYLKEEKEKGRIKHLGFSFHGHRDDFPYFADKHPWDFVMIQANYLDWEVDGEYLYHELEKRDIQAMIMEPVRGGMLATLNPEAVKILHDAAPDRSTASWAIQYIASKPNVLTVLSGMSNMEQVKDNVKTMSNFHLMTDKEQQVLDKALSAFLKVNPLPCTECAYCMPCPAKVNIPAVFHVFNQCVQEGIVPSVTGSKDTENQRKRKAFLAKLNRAVPGKNQPSHCTGCEICKTHCPQNIDIPAKMKELAAILKGR